MMARRCPYAHPVRYADEGAFRTRWYCKRRKAWCPYRARWTICPYLPPPPRIFYEVRESA